MVARHITETQMRAALQEQHAMPGFGQHSGHNASARSRTDNDRIVMASTHNFTPRSNPVIFQEAICGLPPFPGSL
jgi:hypothetical protein